MVFYFELIGKSVVSEDHVPLGKLRDILFLPGDVPKVSSVMVELAGHRRKIPIAGLRVVSGRIEVKSVPKTNRIEPQELSATKVLLDQQIIDLVGNKVVRVNDIVFQDVPTFSVSGIDIGIAGILRRLKVENIIQQFLGLFHAEIPLRLLSWGDVLNLELKQGQIVLKQHQDRLDRIRAEDLADYLESTNIQNIEIFVKSLGAERAAAVVKHLQVNYQVELFQNFEPPRAADLIKRIEPDEAVDILLALERVKRDKIMKLLPNDKQQTIHQLMTFSRTQVGKRMTNQFCAVESHMTVRDIVKKIKRETTDFASLAAMYVVNRDDQLVGVFSPHELLMQDPETPAYKFMVAEPIVILLTTPLEIVINKLLKYKLTALPVINREKKILGIITVDDVSDVLRRKLV